MRFLLVSPSVRYCAKIRVPVLDRFVKSIANHADFNFDQGSLRRTPANPPLGKPQNNPRVKLDLNLWQRGKPYVGVRMIIPVGN